jgi:D-alanyl-D-alanine carboxypeptidase
VAPETLAPGAPSPRDLSGSALGFLAGPGERPTARAAAALPGPYPGAAMTAGRSFRLCSLTKTFTATLVFMLVDEGRLGLGDTVFDLLARPGPGSDLITVDMLLTHTSVLYDYARDTAFLALVAREDGQGAGRRASSWTTPRPGRPSIRRRKGYNYASTNYILLGMIIEAVTGEAWQDLVVQAYHPPPRAAHLLPRGAVPARGRVPRLPAPLRPART